jgi:AraC-like DNA-binding protein
VPIAKGNEALAGYLIEYADQVLGTTASGGSLIERVRSAIWNAIGDGRPTLSRIAADVALPERTLQRRLADEGTSLHDQIEDVRKSMALATLRDHRMSVEEVAYLLGYTEPSTFFRSFRRWTGTTPHRYRRTAPPIAVAPDASLTSRNAMMTPARTRDV